MHWWQALFDGSYIQVKANLAFIDKHSLYYHGQNCLHVVCIGGNTTNHVKIIQMILKTQQELCQLEVQKVMVER